MKTKSLISISLLALLAIGGWFFRPTNQTEEVKLLSEKKRVKASGFDKPNEFMEYMKAIRTKEGETEPGYAPNYRMVALKKAIADAPVRKKAAMNWIERGPGNVGGRTRSILIDPDDPQNTWIAGSVSGGIWKTTDAGQSWTEIAPQLPNLAITTLAWSASDKTTIYAGTGEGFYNIDRVRGDGLFKSTDGGSSWDQLSSTSANEDFFYVNKIIVDPSDKDVLYAATNTGLFKSENGGTSWTELYKNTGRVQDVEVASGDFQTVFITENQVGIHKSTDGGATWTQVFSSDIGRFELAPSIEPTKWFATAENSTYYFSSNSGNSWRQIDIGSSRADYLRTQGWYDLTMTAHPYNEDAFFVGGVGLGRITVTRETSSSVSGSARVVADPYGFWSFFLWPTNRNLHPDHHFLTTIKTDEANERFTIVNGNDGGIGVSTNGGSSFDQLANGYNTSQFYGAAKVTGKNQYFGGTQDNGSFLSPTNPDKSSSYSFEIGGDGFEVICHATDEDRMIGGAYNNSFRYSTNGGGSWTAVRGDIVDDGPFISRLSSSDKEPDLLVAVGNTGVWVSQNFGRSWSVTRMTDGWTNERIRSEVARVSLASENVVWAGGGMTETQSIHVSQDQASSFQEVSRYAPIEGHRISNIATHPTDAATAYLLCSGYGVPKVIRTTDYGQTWEDLSQFEDGKSQNGFPNVAVYSLLVMPHNTDVIWAGTEIGLFESTDGGNSWHFANNGFPSVSVWQLSERDNQIVVATHGRGIWTLATSELTGSTPAVAENSVSSEDDDFTVDPISYDASQQGQMQADDITEAVGLKVYPTPVVSDSKIEISAGDEAKDILVKIFDMSGKAVMSKKSTGLKVTIPLSSNQFERGNYIIKANVGGKIITERFSVVK